MSALSRRGFLSSAAAFVAGPALAQRSGIPSGEVDCIIVGAGAAGIAAARRLREVNRSFVLVEASNRIGGRCIVEQQSFGVPFDRGAHLIHNPDINPLTKLAARTGLEIYQAPSAQRIRIGRRNARDTKVELSTTKGTIVGRHCIITASTNVILDRIKFDGGLPKRHQDAMEKLRLGSFDHIALELPGNPLGLPRDDVVFEKASGPRTGALTANIGGTTLSTVSIGGKFGRDLAAQGDKAMVEFAVEWLGGMFGPGVKKALGRTQVTQWSKDQWIQGAVASPAPGWQG